MSINLKDYEIIYSFPVMWSGWECDDVAHIALNKQGERVLLFGSHTGFYEHTVGTLIEKMEEYTEAIDKTLKAIKILNPTDYDGT
jgi:hypothetical protein